jgi:hypothetical protein
VGRRTQGLRGLQNVITRITITEDPFLIYVLRIDKVLGKHGTAKNPDDRSSHATV